MKFCGPTSDKLQQKHQQLFLTHGSVLYNIPKPPRNPIGGTYFSERFLNRTLIQFLVNIPYNFRRINLRNFIKEYPTNCNKRFLDFFYDLPGAVNVRKKIAENLITGSGLKREFKDGRHGLGLKRFQFQYHKIYDISAHSSPILTSFD